MDAEGDAIASPRRPWYMMTSEIDVRLYPCQSGIDAINYGSPTYIPSWLLWSSIQHEFNCKVDRLRYFAFVSFEMPSQRSRGFKDIATSGTGLLLRSIHPQQQLTENSENIFWKQGHVSRMSYYFQVTMKTPHRSPLGYALALHLPDFTLPAAT